MIFPSQLEVLENYYKQVQKPCQGQLEVIAKKANLSLQQTKNWFEKRAKHAQPLDLDFWGQKASAELNLQLAQEDLQKYKKQYKEEKKKFDLEIQSNTKEMGYLKKANEDLTARNEAYKTQVGDMDRDIQILLKDNSDSMLHLKAQHDSAISGLKAEKEGLEKANLVLKAEKQSLLKSVSKLESEIKVRADLAEKQVFKIEELEETLEALDVEAQNEGLIEENAGLKRQNEVLERANLAWKAKAGRLEQIINNVKDQVIAESDEAEGLRVELEKTLEAQKCYKAQSESKIQELQKDLEAQKQANLEYNAQIESLKAHCEDQKEAILDYKTQIKDLEDQNQAQIEDLKAQKQAQIETQIHANEVYTAQIKGLKAQYEAEIESEKAQMKSKFLDFERALQAQNQASAAYEAQIEGLKAQKDELKQELKELRETWRVSGVLMNTLMQEAIEMRKTQQPTESVQNELENMKQAESDYKLQIEELKEKLEKNQKQWEKELEAVEDDYKRIIEDMREHIKTTEKEREDELTKLNNGNQVVIASLRNQLRQAQKSFDDDLSYYLQAKQSKRDLMNQNLKIKTQLEKAQKNCLRIQARHDEMDNQYLQAKDKLEWAELEIQKKQEGLDSLTLKIRKMEEKNTEKMVENAQKLADMDRKIEELNRVIEQQDEMINEMEELAEEDEDDEDDDFGDLYY